MVSNILQRFLKGDECEEKIFNQLLQFIKNINRDSQIIPKYYAPTGEIDILIVDPILGILVLDIKNWKHFSSEIELKKAINTLKRHNDFILELLKEKFLHLPINTDFKLIFCQKPPEKLLNSKWVNAMIQSKKIIIADEEGNFIKDLFEINYNLTDDSVIDNKDKFQEVLEILALIDLQNFKNKTKKSLDEEDFGRIYITPNGILYLDIKFSSILSSYKGGLRIIRGLAGTGKTIILTNLVFKNPKKKFLFLCFNRLLKNNLEEAFKAAKTDNVIVLSLFELLYKLEPSLSEYKKLKEKWNYIVKNKEKIKEKLIKFLKEHRIDIIIIDEAQDFSPEILRSIFEVNSNLVIGIDEGQNIYDFGISNIKEDVFKDVNLRGKVTNLKTIYRTPENIAKTAIQILALDKNLHSYYRNEYLERKNRLRYLLPGGKLYKTFRKKEALNRILEYLNSKQEDYMILIPNKSFREKFNKELGLSEIPDEKITTIDSVKGLESDNIIILGFNEYLIQNIKYNPEKIYRRLYTLLTRAKKRIYIDLYWNPVHKFLNSPSNKEIKFSKDLYNNIRTIYLILEKESIQWLADVESININFEKDNIISSFFSKNGEVLKNAFKKAMPLIEFLANAKSLFV